MKKIFLSFAVLATFMLQSTTQAAELILYSQDNFEIKSDAYIQDEKKIISLVKDSNLTITYTNDKDFISEEKEPVVDLRVYKVNEVEPVVTIKSPSKKMSVDEGPAFQAYLTENSVYFSQSRLDGKNLQLTVPLTFQSGNYRVEATVSVGTKKSVVDFSFTLSDSPYSFTNSSIIIEDTNVLAQIEYISLLKEDTTSKVVVTLTSEGKELFKKESDKVFYGEGIISLDETIPALADLTGTAELKVEVLNSNGQVILSDTKMIDIQKSTAVKIYYIIVGVLILLLIALFFILKTKKTKVASVGLAIVFIVAAGSITLTVKAATCQGVAKPADQCLENKVITFACQISNSCSTTDARVRKYFSSGNVVNIISDQKSPGPTSVSINVCTNIGESLADGNAIYVISDSNGSHWQRKRFHVFRFAKGTAATVSFDPGGDKRNVNTAVYNGSCGVTVSAKYSGGSSNYKNAKTTIVEVGKVTAGTCRARTVNDDSFESNAGMLDREYCGDDNGSLRNTYIAGSVYMTPVKAARPWDDKTVNICGYLGIDANDIAGLKSQNKSFYALTEQTSSWTLIRFPVYAFKFGVVYKDAKTINQEKKSDAELAKIYRYVAKKENVPSMSYDGKCSVTMRLFNYGDDTDQWSGDYTLIELGMTSNATCRAPILVATASYKYDGEGLNPKEVENTSKSTKYPTIAPFFAGLGDCKAVSECSYTGTWIAAGTNQDCGLPPPPTNCSCANRTYICTGASPSVTPNSPMCDLKASCTVETTSSNTTFKIVPQNGVGNITYTHGSVSATQNNTDPYVYTTSRTPGVQSISVLLRDIFNGQTVTSSCYVTNPPADDGTGTTTTGGDEEVCSCEGSTLRCMKEGDQDVTVTNNSPLCEVPPPTIDIIKTPAVTLNKNGQCTINWKIENMPTGATCVLTGGPSPRTVAGTGTYVSDPLVVNTKFVITCSGGSLNPVISKSVICRVNPDVKEN